MIETHPMSRESMPSREASPEASSVSDPGVLVFSCAACGKALTAPLSAAGVVAPCPTCAVNTQAPAAPGEPRAVAPQPRPTAVPGGKALSAGEIPATPAPSGQGGGGPGPAAAAVPGDEAVAKPEARRRRRTKGSINPSTALSSAYEDRKEVGALLRIVLAVALTAAIALAVYYFLDKQISGPSEPRVSLLVSGG